MNKKKLFKNIIIGSGPSAVAGLMALKESNGNNAIITGHLKSKLLLKKFNIHKKILFESDDDTKYLNNIFTNKSRLIFSISKVGGFGNFWGQGCEYVPFEKLFVKKLFKNKKKYDDFIKTIYEFFKIQNKRNEKIKINENFFYPSPILENSPSTSKSGLKSFIYAFNFLTRKKKLKIINRIVKKIEKKRNFLKIELSDKKFIYCKKIFLAGNAIGNTKILFNSDLEIDKISFSDDCPNIIYGLSLNKILNKHSKKFYSLISSNRKSNFISIINLKNLSLEFVIYYFTKMRLGILKNFKFNLPFNFLFFQVWNPKTPVKAYFTRNNKFYSNESKYNCQYFETYLKNNNVKIIKRSKTMFGEGFHYHNLNVKIKKKWIKLNLYLRKKFNNKVICIDSSNENKINPGPFTITQMSIAMKKVKLFS